MLALPIYPLSLGVNARQRMKIVSTSLSVWRSVQSKRLKEEWWSDNRLINWTLQNSLITSTKNHYTNDTNGKTDSHTCGKTLLFESFITRQNVSELFKVIYRRWRQRRKFKCEVTLFCKQRPCPSPFIRLKNEAHFPKFKTEFPIYNVLLINPFQLGHVEINQLTDRLIPFRLFHFISLSLLILHILNWGKWQRPCPC